MDNYTTGQPNVTTSLGDVNLNISGAGHLYKIDMEILLSFQKVFYFGLIPLVVVVGIVGNILSMIVLFRQKKKTSTLIVLFGLSVAEFCFLILSTITLFGLEATIIAPKYGFSFSMKLIPYFNVYIYPVPGRIGHMLLVVVSIERAISVTFPLKIKHLCTKKIMIILVICVYLFVALISVPNLFLYELKSVTLPDGNVTMSVVLGRFGKHIKAYEVYYICSESILRFMPMGIVIICNSVISVTLIVSLKWRKRNTDACTQQKSDEIQITKTLLAITVVYVFCLLPSTISRLMILNDPNATFYEHQGGIHNILSLVGFLTETVNASINFIIYIAFSKSYRKEFAKLCCSPMTRGQLPTLSRSTEHRKVYQVSSSLPD